jgi:apolipoprotein N-acyltransferase
MPTAQSAVRRRPVDLISSALLAFAGGGSMVLSFAPFGLYPFAVLSLAIFYQVIHRQHPRRAFGLGWVFGIGLFGLGVFWIRISLNEFGNMSTPVANGLMLVFVAAMALFCALAAWLIQRLQPNDGGPFWAGPLLILPAVWVLLEWIRGWLFTGFPWLLAGNGQINPLPLLGAPLAGLAPVLGVQGMGLAVALSAGLLWGVVHWRGRARHLALAALVLLWLGAGLLGRIEWTQPDGEPISATVVQGNVEQAIKWDPNGLLPTLQVYLELTREHLGDDLIVWPETAIPDFLHQVQRSLIEPLSETARESGTEIVIGVPIMETSERYYNGLISIGSADDQYHKRHLVPFGEFLPLKAQLRPLIDWFEVPMSDFSRGSAARPLLQVGEHLVGVSICYEDVFPEEVRQALPDAAYLINVSNDAWFGDSLAPHQHLEFARLRALENGRPLVRATNTGISAIIDHRGHVVGSIPSFVRGTLTAEIQPRAGMTPFSRVGNRPTLLAACLMLVAVLLVRPRAGPGRSNRPRG